MIWIELLCDRCSSVYMDARSPAVLRRGARRYGWVRRVVDGSLKAPEVAKASAARWGTESPVYRMLVEQPKKSCRISLQNHNDEAWFKNLKIRRM